MNRMIQKLKPNSLVLVSEASRLGRSYQMVESILKLVKKKKSFIISVSENLVYGLSNAKDKQFITKVIDSEKESDTLSMRVKNAQSYIKRNGGYIGKAPFGYSIVKNGRNIPVLKANSADFELIDQIVNLAQTQGSYNEISNLMNSKGLLFKNKLWTSGKIKYVLDKFYPEHMMLSVGKKSNSLIVISGEDEGEEDGECEDVNVSEDKDKDIDMSDDLTNGQIKPKTQIKNTPSELLKITISKTNGSRIVEYSSSKPKSNNTSNITLRSGRVVNKFF
jgi:DNA invertase Pin-like site-specific DNA recombinase